MVWRGGPSRSWGACGTCRCRAACRHTTATILNRLGLDDVTRTAIMGHSRVSTTNEIYTHVELDRLVAATDGVERAIEG